LTCVALSFSPDFALALIAIHCFIVFLLLQCFLPSHCFFVFLHLHLHCFFVSSHLHWFFFVLLHVNCIDFCVFEFSVHILFHFFALHCFLCFCIVCFAILAFLQ
jgi:hypothetical protein